MLRSIDAYTGNYTGNAINRFVRWRKAGVWDWMMDAITAAHDGDIQMIDNISIRATNRLRRQKKGNRDHCFGRFRGGLTTKVHAAFGRQGLPMRLNLTAGQSHDGQAADALLEHVGAGTIVLADKAYDADRIRVSLRDRGAFAKIPPKVNRPSKPYISIWLYRERNLIERFFSKLKYVRRVEPAMKT